eukprot:TRINITY_DN10515_c0_g1_i1.p1 TRINITY_DN10515_c0_g1~~TRINITY_DN10515_c0_g1_i1.p1  ORF type:complete len:311 (-),score=52.13 TRINITY_DN10515_c0_g1_i1:52-984(-)
MSRNDFIRASLLSQLGVSTRNNPSVHLLLDDNVIDIKKLTTFLARKESLSEGNEKYRGTIWCILLGMLPIYKNAWTFVLDQYREQYIDLKKTAYLIEKSVDIGDHILSRDIDENYFEEVIRCFSIVYPIHKKMIQGVNDIEDHTSVEISNIGRVFAIVCDTEYESYWGLFYFLNSDNKKGFIHENIETLTSLLIEYNHKLYIHFMELDIQIEHFAFGWLKSCFSSCFTVDMLCSLWDKLFSVDLNEDFSVCVALAILLNDRTQRLIHQLETAIDVINFLQCIKLSDEEGELILLEAMSYLSLISDTDESD